MKVNIINKSPHPLPHYETLFSAGMDIRVWLKGAIVLKPFERKLLPTGLYIALPIGYEAQVRSRSGLSLKHGIICLNAPGTIDADYRGEIGVIIANMSTESYVVSNGDRIAQMIVAKHERIDWLKVEVLEETLRGANGFGSTGA